MFVCKLACFEQLIQQFVYLPHYYSSIYYLTFMQNQFYSSTCCHCTCWFWFLLFQTPYTETQLSFCTPDTTVFTTSMHMRVCKDPHDAYPMLCCFYQKNIQYYMGKHANIINHRYIAVRCLYSGSDASCVATGYSWQCSPRLVVVVLSLKSKLNI